MDKVIIVVAGFFLALFISLILLLPVSWLAMLLFGAVHTFLPVVPAFGFWQTVAILALLRLALPGGPSVNTSD